jgi:hypothetical protein
VIGENGWEYTNFFLSFGGYPDTIILGDTLVNLETGWGISSSKKDGGMRFEI